MEKTFPVYCRHVSFVTKGDIWCYYLRLRRREEFRGGGGHSKIGRENWGGGVMLNHHSPLPPVKNEWSLTENDSQTKR